jgi:hypothetical protein
MKDELKERIIDWVIFFSALPVLYIVGAVMFYICE